MWDDVVVDARRARVVWWEGSEVLYGGQGTTWSEEHCLQRSWRSLPFKTFFHHYLVLSFVCIVFHKYDTYVATL